MAQIAGSVRIPAGKKVAVNISCDFDAQAIWIGSFNLTSPAYMSRGEFGAEVAVPRLLKMFDEHKIKTTWCIPGHTVDTWPELFAARLRPRDMRLDIMVTSMRIPRQ